MAVFNDDMITNKYRLLRSTTHRAQYAEILSKSKILIIIYSDLNTVYPDVSNFFHLNYFAEQYNWRISSSIQQKYDLIQYFKGRK